MTVGQWLAGAEQQLAKAGIGSARLDAQILLEQATGRDRASLLASPETELTAHQLKTADESQELRRQRQPMSHLLGRREFYCVELEVTPDVLTPRVETEVMAEWAIADTLKNGRLFDMGTGSGALAIAIAHHRRDLRITAAEVSAEALTVARRNAQRYKLSINFIQSDLWQKLDDKFDAIVTNLPYLSDQAMSELMPEAKLEPRVALEGGRDGLDLYRRFLSGLPAHLNPGGRLFTECDPWQQSALIKEAAKVGLKPYREDYFCLAFQNSAK